MRKRVVLFLLIAIFLFSCGIEENFYLPQVPQSRISRTLNESAIISLPSVDSTEYYYAQNYAIFYRIYISSDQQTGDPGAEPTVTYLNTISSSLNSDYSSIYTSIDPTNYAVNNTSSFFGINQRKYFQLELEGANIDSLLSLGGGTLTINFPTHLGEYPTASLNGGAQYNLSRSRTIDSLQPPDDYSFRNTSELYNYSNSTYNIDVNSSNNLSLRYAYAAMYIVLIGNNQAQFSAIYSKPTLISIFRLTETGY